MTARHKHKFQRLSDVTLFCVDNNATYTAKAD